MERKINSIQKETDRLKIKKSISDSEDRKAKLFFEMGMKTYYKIRKGELSTEDFEEICDEIKNLDIDIYTQYMKLRQLQENSKRTTCECGYVAFKDEKFCPQCGQNLQPKELEYKLCKSCNSKIDIDSNFCGCCGHKIEDEIEEGIYQSEILYDIYDEDKLDDNDIKEDSLEEEIYDEEEYIELEGREFLIHQQKNEDE